MQSFRYDDKFFFFVVKEKDHNPQHLLKILAALTKAN